MFKIPAKETAIAYRLFAYSMLIATSYVIARTVGDSLFLSQVGNDQLALVYVLAGFGTTLFAGAWYLATRKLNVSLSIVSSSIVFGCATILVWYLLPQMKSSFWLLAGIYLLAEIKGCINAINILSALNTKLGRESSKASWTFVGLSTPLASVIIGSVLAVESQAIGLREWLLVIAFLDFVCALIGMTLARTPSVKILKQLAAEGKKKKKKKKKGRLGKLKKYVSTPKFQQWLGILFSAKIIALTIVSFEWKLSVNTFFHGQPDQLVRYFGIYYGSIGIVTVACQFLFTSRLMKRKDFRTSLLLMPIALGAFTGFLFLAPPMILLFATTAAKSLEAWRRSVHDTIVSLLYTRIKRENRRFAISLNNGFVKPISEVIGACTIYFGSLQLHRPVLVVITVVWVIAALKLIQLVSKSKKAKQHVLLLGRPAPLKKREIQTKARG